MVEKSVISGKGERLMKRITVLMFLVLFVCSVTLAFAADQKDTSSMAGEQNLKSEEGEPVQGKSATKSMK
jgi:preprotein translocase subunit SecG